MHILNWGSRLLSAALIVTLAACSSANKVESNLGLEGVPDWVNQGTQALNNKDGRLFHGVGMAREMGDMALQKSTADNRARTEVALILTSFLKVVGKDYAASEKTANTTENVTSVSRQISSMSEVNLPGSRIIASYRDTKKNVIYSLAELDIKQVSPILDSVKDMNQDLRLYFDENADNIFDRLTKGKR